MITMIMIQDDADDDGYWLETHESSNARTSPSDQHNLPGDILTNIVWASTLQLSTMFWIQISGWHLVEHPWGDEELDASLQDVVEGPGSRSPQLQQHAWRQRHFEGRYLKQRFSVWELHPDGGSYIAGCSTRFSLSSQIGFAWWSSTFGFPWISSPYFTTK